MIPTLLLIFLCSSCLADNLFSIVPEDSDPPPPDTDTIPACKDNNVKSCTVIQINFSALDKSVLTFKGLDLSLKDKPSEGSFTFTGDDGTEATFTSEAEGHEGHIKVAGNIHLGKIGKGRDFSIEPCRESHGCHVLIEQHERHWVDEESTAVEVSEEEMRYAELNRRIADPAKIEQGKSDPNTIVTYSVMFYYTPEFKNITEDIPSFVDQVIAETNQGYINSKLPLRVKKHCIAPAPAGIHDNSSSNTSSSKLLNQFRASMSIEELLNSADAAALLVEDFDSCGIGFFASFKYGLTLSATKKSCALGYYSFGHELGHNFGCSHDKKQSPNSAYSYGLGKHIPGTGSRTIMAYYVKGFGPRVNYWSNPLVNYENVPTGTAEENNARILREHRFAFADIGDESSPCPGTTETVNPAPIEGTSVGATGIVQSENYPGNYPLCEEEDYNCDRFFNIVVEDGRKIKISFNDFDIENDPTCRYDYLQIYEGNENLLLDKTCGTSKPADIITDTNRAFLIFHYDYSVSRKGFKLTWTEV